MRLLIVQGGFGAGGAEKIVAMIAKHRAAAGDEVTVVGFTMPEAGSYFPYPEGVRLIVPPRGRGPAPLARLRAIRAVMREVKPHATLSFLTKINVLSVLAALGLRRPVAISERNNPRAQNAHPIWRHAQNLTARKAASVVMQTQRALDDLPAGVRKRAVIIHNPCAPYSDITVKADTDGLQLSAVGRLDAQKGYDFLLNAMARVQAACPGVHLTIHGEGPLRGALEQQRTALGLDDVVSLPGSSKRPGGWLESSDMLIMSSRFEGFPNVIAEAAVSGLPVISFDCDYGPRELIEDGRNGLLVPTGDVDALADAIITLIQDPARRAAMRLHAEDSQTRLAPDRILAQWDSVIDQIARAD